MHVLFRQRSTATLMQQLTTSPNVTCADPTTLSELYEQHTHRYISLIICSIGAVSQLLNLIIFTRKHMTVPKKSLLAGLAATDLALSLCYLPITWYMFFQLNYEAHRDRLSYSWTVALVLHFYVSQVLLMVSVWLMLMVAVFRYVAIFNPLRYQYWCNVIAERRTIVFGCIACMLLRTPFLYSAFVTNSSDTLLQEFRSCENRNMPMGTNAGLVILRMNKSSQRWPYRLSCSVLFNLVPSAILIVISFRLLYLLRRSRQSSPDLMLSGVEIDQELNQRHRRTTRILLITLFMFLLTELPQGILTITAYFSSNKKEFYEECYSRVANINDLIVVTTSSFNFVVYYLMYERFRLIFKSLFYPCRRGQGDTNGRWRGRVLDGLRSSLESRWFSTQPCEEKRMYR